MPNDLTVKETEWANDVFDKVEEKVRENNLNCTLTFSDIDCSIMVKNNSGKGLKIEYNSIGPYYEASGMPNFDRPRSVNFAAYFCIGKIKEWLNKV